MIRLFVLIRSLDIGGAERQLIEVAKRIDKRRFAVTFATFYDGGALRPEIEGVAGVRVLSLQKTARWDVVPFLARLQRAVLAERPHIIQGCMSISNELSLVLGRLTGAKVVWALQASNMDWSRYTRTDALIFRNAALFSRFPDLIINNSHAGLRHHVAQGYAPRRMVVIPNGFDTDRFRPDREAGRQVRRAWGIQDGECLIGLVARLDAMKDHPTFLRAAARLARERADVRFVCVGVGDQGYTASLESLAEHLALGKRLVWAGPRTDMQGVYNTLDLLTSSSAYGEGVSNVLGEAMACGIPCVATDVGDSSHVVGETGEIVPAGDPAALSMAWEKLLAAPLEHRHRWGAAARERILQEYSMDRLIARTEDELGKLVP